MTQLSEYVVVFRPGIRLCLTAAATTTAAQPHWKGLMLGEAQLRRK